MRQTNQLLTIVLEELEKEKEKKKNNELSYFSGLCYFFRKLRCQGIISEEEENLLYLFIENNRPNLTDVCTLSTIWHHRRSEFFFTPRKITPRIHYIKWLLKKFKNDSI